MNNKVEWKVEALTDGLNFSDVTDYVQALNIKIGGADDVDEFDTGVASLTLDNRDARFDPENPEPFYTGRGRINYTLNPDADDLGLASAESTGWAYSTQANPTQFVGVARGTAYGGSFSRDYDGIGINFFYPQLVTFLGSERQISNPFDLSEYNDSINIGDVWNFSVDIAIENTLNQTKFALGLQVLDEDLFVVGAVAEQFDFNDYPDRQSLEMYRYSATLPINFQFINTPKYIRPIIIRYSKGTPSPNRPHIFYKNALFEKVGEEREYFSGATNPTTYFGTKWLGTPQLSPSFDWTEQPFEINTEIKLSARSASNLPYVSKFQGYIRNLSFDDSVDDYPIVTLALSDKTASYTTKPVTFSNYANWALNNVPLASSNAGVIGFSDFLLTEDVVKPKYFEMSEIIKKNNKDVFKIKSAYPSVIRDVPNPPASLLILPVYLSQNGYPTNDIEVVNLKAFTTNLPPFADGLSNSTLVTHSGQVDAFSGQISIPDDDPRNFIGILGDWNRRGSSAFWLSCWYKPINIPAGGLSLWQAIGPKVATKTDDLNNDYTAAFEIIVNSNGSISFRTTTVGGVATTISTDVDYIDPTAPLNIAINVDFVPSPIFVYVNGKFCIDLSTFIAPVSDPAAPFIYTIRGTAGGSFLMSDLFLTAANAIIGGDFSNNVIDPDFIEGYNYAVDIDYETLPEKAKFIRDRSDIKIKVPQAKFNTNEVDAENLLQTQYYEQSLLDGFKSLSNSTYGYLTMDYNENEPQILTRHFLQENTQLTNYTFSDKDIASDEIKFRSLSYERDAETIQNDITLKTPEKFDTITKFPLDQPSEYQAQNEVSIKNYGLRTQTFESVNVKEDASQGYVDWRSTGNGDVYNKVKGIDFIDGVNNSANTITNIKLGQKVTLKRSVPRLSPNPTIKTDEYRITQISINASIDQTVCQLGLKDLKFETMSILDIMELDENRLGF